jgi:hypothetical protein
MKITLMTDAGPPQGVESLRLHNGQLKRLHHCHGRSLFSASSLGRSEGVGMGVGEKPVFRPVRLQLIFVCPNEFLHDSFSRLLAENPPVDRSGGALPACCLPHLALTVVILGNGRPTQLCWRLTHNFERLGYGLACPSSRVFSPFD